VHAALTAHIWRFLLLLLACVASVVPTDWFSNPLLIVLASIMQVSCYLDLPLYPRISTPCFAVTINDQAPSNVCGFWISIASQVSSAANPNHHFYYYRHVLFCWWLRRCETCRDGDRNAVAGRSTGDARTVAEGAIFNILF